MKADTIHLRSAGDERKELFIIYNSGGSALLVVLIHSSFPGRFGIYIKSTARIAVPIFLMISGYYAFKCDRDDGLQRIKSSIHKTAKLAIIVLLIYSVANCLDAILTGNLPFAWLISHLTVSDIIGLIVFNHSVFVTEIMWYFLALLYVYYIVLMAMKWGKLNVLIKSIPICLILNIISGEVMNLPWFVAGNFLLTGLPFFLMGYWIRKNDVCMKMSKCNLWVMLILGMCLTLIETTILGNIYVYIGTIMSAFAVFCLSFKYKMQGQNFLTIMGEKYSTYIFVLHGLVIKGVNKLNLFIQYECWHWIKPIVIIFISIGASIILRRMSLAINDYLGGELKNYY